MMVIWSFKAVAFVKQSKKARKPQIKDAQVEIHALSHEAHGVSRSQEKVMFVPGALPGETVKVRIEKEMRHFNHGKILEIITPSPERVSPPCPHYQRCGACQLQHLQSDKQLGYKQSNLHEQLKRQLKLDTVPWQAPITSEDLGYRRRARLGVRYRNKLDEIIVGFREEANSHLTSIGSCPVLQPSLSNLIEPLQSLISLLQAKSRVTQLELIASDEKDVVVLRHLKKIGQEDQAIIKDWASSHNAQFYLQGDEAEDFQCLWPSADTAADVSLNYSVLGNTLDFNVKNFIQGNRKVNIAMVTQALEWLDGKPDESLLDLFAGIGNFSIPAAKHFKKVLAVEGISSMVAQINHNAQLNNLSNVQAQMMNLNDDILLQRLPKADAVLLDPPRTGAAELMPWLSKLSSRILYVACEPSSLVRDARVLLDAGFKLEKIATMDMFPQTKHVETMALFTKK